MSNNYAHTLFAANGPGPIAVPSDSPADVSNIPSEDSALRTLLVVYCKGLAMGAADAVPGVSGGTIALITGIYERLIRALTHLDPRVLRQVPSLYDGDRRREFATSLREMDVPFLVILGTGMVTAVVVLARFVQLALSTVPAGTFAFFFGLIGASAVVLADRRWVGQADCVAAGAVGFGVAFLLAGVSAGGSLPQTLPVVFGAGLFAISGMVLPGISGAFILLLLGQYDPLTNTLNEFVDAILALLTGTVTGTLATEGTVVGTFLAGAVVGLFTVAYLVRWALDRYRAATLAFLVSLMVGALRLPVLEILSATDAWSALVILEVVGPGVFGAALVLLLDRYTADLDYDRADTPP